MEHFAAANGCAQASIADCRKRSQSDRHGKRTAARTADTEVAMVCMRVSARGVHAKGVAA
jgi:hypothetical protein